MSKEMTIRDIAGFCPEVAVWKMMANVCEFLLKDSKDCLISPDSIVIDVNSFIIETGKEGLLEYFAPEQTKGIMPGTSAMVWSIGAVAYFMATGHVVFGGHGSIYQKEHPSVLLPILPKEFQALTPILHQCLCYNTDERISLKELKHLSDKGLLLCENRQRNKSVVDERKQDKKTNNIGEQWPEEMIEI